MKILLLSATTPALVASLFCSTAAAERYQVRGTALYFDMTAPFADGRRARELEPRDVELFQLEIMENPQITEIVLSGPGGWGPAAQEIAKTIIAFNLDTRASGNCASACATIFLAGRKRSLDDGATLGFHRPYVEGDVEREYFEYYRVERGWKDEFDYVEWIYDVGLTDMRDMFAYILSRGVDPDFIIEANSYSGQEMWFPDVVCLRTSGVLTQ